MGKPAYGPGMSRKLTDNEVHERMAKAADALGTESAASPRVDVVLAGVRLLLEGGKLAVLRASEATDAERDPPAPEVPAKPA